MYCNGKSELAHLVLFRTKCGAGKIGSQPL